MKKITALFLCVCLLVSLPVFAFAAEAEEAEGVHECSGLVFDRPLHGVVSGTLESGNYYIDGECSLLGHVRIEGEVNLCLNGHPIAVQGSTTFLVCDGGVLSIYDCGETGLIGHYNTTLNNHPLTVEKGGTANVYGGWLYARDGSNAINNRGGTVNIYGGRIESGWDFFCAVLNEGELNLYGGELIGFIGVSQRHNAVLNFCGSEFSVKGTRKALQYIEDISPLVIRTPYYLWRADPEAEFTPSTELPFESVDSYKYVEFAPMIGQIEYVTDGGSISGDAPGEYVCGEGCALPEVRRSGYVFSGWYDAAEGGERLERITEELSGDLVLYARYEPVSTPEPSPPAEAAPEAEPPATVRMAVQQSASYSHRPLVMVALGMLAVLLLIVYILLRATGRKRGPLD